MMDSAWQLAGCSVVGASHLRAGLENQDAIAWCPEEGSGHHVALSVADGHGSPRSFRSAAGARFANEVALDLAEELMDASLSPDQLRFVKDRLEQDAPRRLVREWRARVQRDVAAHPFSSNETDRLEPSGSSGAPKAVEEDPWIAYGTTLLTVVATPVFTALWQIGDGDVVTVSPDGEPSKPLKKDKLLLGNVTTSLCSEDAWRFFRVGLLGRPMPVVLLSTDGFANSFQDDAGFMKFGSDLFDMLVAEGLDAVEPRIPGWLREMSERGSGDDISLGLLWQGGLFPPHRLGVTPDAEDPPLARPADPAFPEEELRPEGGHR